MEIENMLKQMLEGQRQMAARLDNIENRLDKMDTRLDSVETRLGNIEGQQKESNQLIGALMHRTEELGAQANALGHTMVRIEGKISQLDEQQDSTTGDISFLVRKVGEHEEAIRQLRRA